MSRARIAPEDREAVVRSICDAVARGALVQDACAQAGISRGALLDWAAAPPLSEVYARARELQSHAFAEECVALADEPCKPEDAARQRLRVDTRKWYVSKIAPKLYGDRVDSTVTIVDTLTPEQREMRVAVILAAAQARALAAGGTT